MGFQGFRAGGAHTTEALRCGALENVHGSGSPSQEAASRPWGTFMCTARGVANATFLFSSTSGSDSLMVLHRKAALTVTGDSNTMAKGNNNNNDGGSLLVVRPASIAVESSAAIATLSEGPSSRALSFSATSASYAQLQLRLGTASSNPTPAEGANDTFMALGPRRDSTELLLASNSTALAADACGQHPPVDWLPISGVSSLGSLVWQSACQS